MKFLICELYLKVVIKENNCMLHLLVILLDFFNVEQLFSLFLVLLTLTVLKITWQLFCRLFLNFSLIFLHDFTRVVHLGQKYHRRGTVFVSLPMTFNLIT